MEPACVRHTELPHTSRLFADYQYHFERVARFYDHDPHAADSFRAAAARIDYPEERRAALVSALGEQNGESVALEMLSRPGTLAVVTGQQVGLFSGPCYTIYKALTAARLARRLSESGLPAVPVFWLATEDHDFAEVNHCWVFDAAHRPLRLDLSAGDSAQRAVGGIGVAGAPVAGLREALREFPFGGDVAEMVAQAYAPGETLGSAFARLLRRLLSSQGLLYLDPLAPPIRRLAAPAIARAVEAADEIRAGVLARSRELEEAGYHAQVHVDEETSFLFLLENGRRLPLAGRGLTASELAARAEQLSPNALLRPVVQDWMLPTVAYVGGPGELAYLAQSQVIYRLLLGRMPVAVRRYGATLLDARAAKLMERYRLRLPDFFHGEEALRERIAASLAPPELQAEVERTRAGVGRLLDGLGESLRVFDRTLDEAFSRSRRKIDYQLSKTGRKAAREALRRNERAEAEAAWLDALIYPHKRLQERFYSLLPFLARHGPGLIDLLAADLPLDCRDHQVAVV